MQYEILSWYSCIQKLSGDAVIFDDGQNVTKISYFELFKNGSLVTNALRNQGCKEGAVVGCIFENNIWIPSIVCGILYCKACVTFYSQNWSQSPQDFTKRHINFIITDDLQSSYVAKNLPFCASFFLGAVKFNIFSFINTNEDMVCPEYPLMYIIETSGTTGKPTIVHVPESSIVPNINSFKLLAFEEFVYAERTLLILREETKKIPEIFSRMLLKHKVSILQCTPSLFLQINKNIIKEELLIASTSLRVIAFGGEKCPPAHLINEWKMSNNKTEFYNLYGITEVSVWAMCYQVSTENLQKCSNSIPLGSPLMATEIDVRNDDGLSIKQGRGRLYVGSHSRICYLDDEIPSSFHKVENAIMRNTGDIVEIDKHGQIFYVDRTDNQIKYNGRKVNLSEIERLVSSIVTSSVAVWDAQKQSVILACIIPSEEVTEEVIQSHLKDIAVPTNIYLVSVFPTTEHGKVDKLKIIELFNLKTSLYREFSQNHEFLKEVFIQKWTSLTSFAANCAKSNFILNGGDSVKAVQLVNEMEFKFGRNFPNLVDILLNKSMNDALEYICADFALNENQNFTNMEITDSEKDFTRIRKNANKLCFICVSRNGINVFCNNSSYVEKNCTFCNDCQKIAATTSSDYKREFNLSVKWRYNLKKCIDASTLVICDKLRLVGFIGSHSGIIVALNLTSGECVWQTKLPGRIESSACSSKCGNFIFIGCYDYSAYCLCSYTGKCIWKFTTNGELKSSPCIHPEIDFVYFGSHDRHVYALQIESGTCKWKQQAGNGSVYASPAVSKDGKFVIAASLDGSLTSFNSLNGQIIWKRHIGQPLFSSPILTDNGICVGCVDKSIYFYDFSGVEVWSYKTGGSIYGSAFISCCSSVDSEYVLIGTTRTIMNTLETSGAQWADEAVDPCKEERLGKVREVGSQAVWSLSSCKPGYGVEQIRDGCLDTYWQSDGPQPHLVNIHFRKKMTVQDVCIYADYKLDESYTPSRISVRVGTHSNDLQEIEVIDLAEPTGWVIVPLKDSSNAPIRTFMVQIAVLSNHQNGRDTHMRQIKIHSPVSHHAVSSLKLPNFTCVDCSKFAVIR
ncbi:Beta-alanine-activating enzyme [Nymphon striatum]|nr:Beta-alanine-activating enzyme [Nymphon striatum]